MVSRAEDTNTDASAIGERSGERAGYIAHWGTTGSHGEHMNAI